MSTTVESHVDETCAYCGLRIFDHDPVCVRDCTDVYGSPTYYCNYAGLSTYVDENNLTTGDAAHEYVYAAAHFVIKEFHDHDIPASEVRPKVEIVDDTQEDANSQENESFSQEEVVQTTRLARDHAFGHFDSGRASNASYEDTQFLGMFRR